MKEYKRLVQFDVVGVFTFNLFHPLQYILWKKLCNCQFVLFEQRVSRTPCLELGHCSNLLFLSGKIMTVLYAEFSPFSISIKYKGVCWEFLGSLNFFPVVSYYQKDVPPKIPSGGNNEIKKSEGCKTKVHVPLTNHLANLAQNTIRNVS